FGTTGSFAKNGLCAAFPKIAAFTIGSRFTKSFQAFTFREKVFGRSFRVIFAHRISFLPRRVMNAAATKKQVESVLSNRFGNVFERHEGRTGETLATGIAEIDELSQGLPRGAITEIHGTASSGRTSLLLSSLAIATAQA